MITTLSIVLLVCIVVSYVALAITWALAEIGRDCDTNLAFTLTVVLGVFVFGGVGCALTVVLSTILLISGTAVAVPVINLSCAVLSASALIVDLPEKEMSPALKLLARYLSAVVFVCFLVSSLFVALLALSAGNIQ